MPTAAIFEAGPLAEWGKFVYQAKNLPPIAKQFLKQPLGLTAMEVSLNELLPGQGLPFLHRHGVNEELYIFLEGEGEFEADGEVRPIRPGTCIRCAPEVARSWRCIGERPLRFVVIQAPAGKYGPGATTGDGQLAPGRPVWRQ